MADITVLNRELYEVGEAARLLGVHARTLRNWLNGYSSRGKKYEPVLRKSPGGPDVITWGEFVEAGYLTEYRRVQRIPLPELREYINEWRDRLGVPYPLAHRRPFAGPGPGLMEAEELDGDRFIYRVRDGQRILTPWADAFVQRVDFDVNVAARFWPSGKDQLVVIDPLRSFGAPTVRGIRTEVLYEMFLAGDPVADVADGYDLNVADIEAAIRYESPRPKPTDDAAAA